ncbi:oxidoreductase [bacterium]|nr:oxidoreductase [bacterium]
MIPLILPQNFEQYELIDSGNGKKLERFDRTILIRPEPQAIWNPRMSLNEWEEMHHAEFKQEGSHKGNWIWKGKPLHAWNLAYSSGKMRIKFKLNFTAFKHIGVFPEQAANWDFIFSETRKRIKSKPSVLNLFAYTGGASLAAKSAGADVVHVDSVKQVISWANENQDLSGLRDIRWVVEDALKFVIREVKRNRQYHGIMLDPPAYGIGAKGERWKLEDKLDELLSQVAKLLHPDGFLVLNVYSLGLSPYIIQNMMIDHFKGRVIEVSELGLKSRSKQILPLGIVGRIS